MRNLNGFSNKILSIFSILFLILPFLSVSKTHASEDIAVSSSFHHNWDGNTLNTDIYLVLSTQSSSAVVTYYTITIPQGQITPTIFSINRNTQLEPTIHRDTDKTSLVVDLENTPVYPDRPITLKVSFSTQLQGDTISLVSSVSNSTTNEFFFKYPSSKGDISWSSAAIIKTDTKDKSIEVQTEAPNTNFVKITFGTEVVYKFKINKSFTNLENETRISEILLPINNSTQHILITSISPQPDKAYRDIDDNYTLQYSVAPQSNMKIEIEGHILMTKSSYPYENTLPIEETDLWKVTDSSLTRHVNRYIKTYGLEISDVFSDINELQTSEQRTLLYEALYKYVIENLQPNTQSIGSLSGSDRLGGQEVLLKQGISTSEDYVDSVISLFRYYKIPARFVIGYISNISNYDSNGMYHYWAEYYDIDEKNWKIVEPFFEDYSKTTLWNKDMKEHIALTYRYSNPYSPKLNFFTNEDFSIEVIKDVPEVKNDLKLDLILQPYKISDPYLVGYINIKNTGNTIFDTFNITKSNPDLTKYVDYIENNSQIILLPNQTYDIKFNIPYKEIETNMFAVLNALSGTQQINDIYVKEDLEILTEQNSVKIFSKLISIFLYILISIPIYFFSKRVKFKHG